MIEYKKKSPTPLKLLPPKEKEILGLIFASEKSQEASLFLYLNDSNVLGGGTRGFLVRKEGKGQKVRGREWTERGRVSMKEYRRNGKKERREDEENYDIYGESSKGRGKKKKERRVIR